MNLNLKMNTTVCTEIHDRFTFTGEALEVEVLVLHPQHLALTWLPALVALNQGLVCGVVVCVLCMSHCKREDINVTIEL